MKCEIKNGLKRTVIQMLLISILLFEISACNKISQGEQRRKFEFLYKMSNYNTLFREYTGILSYHKDFELYKKRMNKLYLDVNDIQIIPGYEPSLVLKTKFLEQIDNNLMIIQNYKPLNDSDTLNIKNDYQIRNMNENVDQFTDLLDDEISKVGKE